MQLTQIPTAGPVPLALTLSLWAHEDSAPEQMFKPPPAVLCVGGPSSVCDSISLKDGGTVKVLRVEAREAVFSVLALLDTWRSYQMTASPVPPLISSVFL